MKKLNDLLNVQVANLAVMYTKLHNFHWFVDGHQFFKLHEKFEEYYDEFAGYFDEVAERMLMIGGTPFASLKEFVENTTLKEVVGNQKLSHTEMVKLVLDDFIQINKEITEVIKVAQELEDEVTVDLLIGISASLQKHNWMLKFYLQ